MKNGWDVRGTVLVMVDSVLILVNPSAVTLRNTLDAPRDREFELRYALLLLISFLAIGYALGVWYTATHRQGARLAFLAAWAFIASFPAYGACNCVAGRFAEHSLAGLPGLQSQNRRLPFRPG